MRVYSTRGWLTHWNGDVWGEKKTKKLVLYESPSYVYQTPLFVFAVHDVCMNRLDRNA